MSQLRENTLINDGTHPCTSRVARLLSIGVKPNYLNNIENIDLFKDNCITHVANLRFYNFFFSHTACWKAMSQDGGY